jgi:hypothetical protein
MKRKYHPLLRTITSIVENVYSDTLFLTVALVVVSCSEPYEVDKTHKLASSNVTNEQSSVSAQAASNLPSFPSDPSAFVDEISNPYLAFEIGKIFQYESETDEGLERVMVEVTNEKKMILGVATTVVHDRVFLDGELIEDTFDWFAEDEDGNVWYFGEDSREIEDGEVVSTEGSWEAGVNGAMPGIIMLANPKNGMKYQQEFAPDIAEDMAIVVNTDKTVEIGLGVFEGCLTTMEFSPLEPGHREPKYYHPGTGLILEGDDVELVSVSP